MTDQLAAVPSAYADVDIEKVGVDELMSRFSVFDPVIAERPYVLLDRVRSECPIGRSEMFDGYWVITKHESMRQVLSDPASFSSTVPIIPRLPGADMSFAIPSGIDPPEHTSYRRLLGAVFSPKRISALEEPLRQLARDGCAEWLATEGPYDFKNGFATTLPCTTLLATLGLPYGDLDRLLHYKDMTIVDQFSPDPAVRKRFAEELPEMLGYFKEHVDARRENPDAPDDFLTALVRAPYQGERELMFEEIANILTVMIGAGLDTTTGEMCLHMDYFARNQDRWQELIDHPERIGGAVEELLRYHGLVTPGRLCMRDTEIGGHLIKEGDLVALVTAAASHDEDEFLKAKELDFQRDARTHMTFGWGPHMCVGNNLARFELRIAYEELTKAIPRFRIAEGTEPRRHAGIVQGMENLELELVR